MNGTPAQQNNYKSLVYTRTTQLHITRVYLHSATLYHLVIPVPHNNYTSLEYTCPIQQLHITRARLYNKTTTHVNHWGAPAQKKLHIISVYLYNTTSYHRAVPAQHKFTSPSHACTAKLFITVHTCTTKAPSACTTQHQPHITGAYCATPHQIPTTLAHLYKTTLPHYWGILVQHNANSTLPKHAGPTQTTITTILRNHLVGSSEQLSRLAFPEESNGIFHEKKGQ